MFIMLYSAMLAFESVDNILKSAEHSNISLLLSIVIYFSVGLLIMVFKIGSNLDFAEEILMCDHSVLFYTQALTNLS